MYKFAIIAFSALFLTINELYSSDNTIHNNTEKKTITISDSKEKLSIQIDYSNGCKINQLKIYGKNILSESGIYTGFRTRGGSFTSCSKTKAISVENNGDRILIKNIAYGDCSISVYETWSFQLDGDKIIWNISRQYNNLAKLEEMAFPELKFKDLSVWKGGILDNGGVVWCKYLKDINDTYGVHTGGITFWNPNNGDALRIKTKSNEKYIAAKYSQSAKKEFVCTYFATEQELEPRYNLSRFVNQKSDVFSPFNVQKKKVDMTIEMEYVDYASEYSRGNLPGIDAEAVRELMNTTGRYGVVDNAIVGANGWITNWKCLHEPFFSQIGMALNDTNYVKNMSATLDSERDYALTSNGRVLSRWHNTDEDCMPGTFNYKTGYYEAKWGYTIDSQTSYVINTAEQFDLCGDITWLKSHKTSCEKALNWLIKRDSNGNGIFEMMNNSLREMKSSDWLDVVWASFENAFVNAQMYEALNLWSTCEQVLGDNVKADHYKSVSLKLKESFNKPISQGGFWLPEKKQYVYWRDKDGSIHGDNLVTPVNFAVIAFGLCDDAQRISQILEQIEKRTVAENLFHWPLCFDSFKAEEGGGNTFPDYENGDIFPTWGYLGVRAYIKYNKQIALKYIRNILAQYKRDGLSSQRYSRVTQKGLGTDILAGICTSITALYRDIYGIRPKWNRMGLEPNMSRILNGTDFKYSLRNVDYHIRLNVNDYEMQTERFTVKCRYSFGANYQNSGLIIYPNNEEKTILKIYGKSSLPFNVTLNHCSTKKLSWEINTTNDYRFIIDGLNPALIYKLCCQGKLIPIKINNDGTASFSYYCKGRTKFKLSTK